MPRMRSIGLGVAANHWLFGIVGASRDELLVAGEDDRIALGLERLPARITRIAERFTEAARTDSGAWVVQLPPRFSGDLEARVAERPRALVAGPRGKLVVLAANGLYFVTRCETTHVAFEAPLAAAFAPGDDERVIVSGENGRIAIVVGTTLTALPPLGDDARAVAHAEGSWLALAGKKVHRFDASRETWSPLGVYGEDREDREEDVTGAFLVARADGRAYAFATSSVGVECRGEGATHAYYHGYGTPPDETMSISGLAFLRDGRLVVAFAGGRGNVLGPTGALKLDEHPGDTYARWVFVHSTGILVAG